MNRPDWDSYFFRIAAEVATRSTCPRASIGAVLVRDKRILSTGYNGPASGQSHCPVTPEHMALAHCLASLHAERNALANATVQTYGATMYVVGPRVICPECRDAMQLCGVDYRYRPSVLTLDSVIREVNEWKAVTFPRVTPASLVEHLRREVLELAEDPTNTSELADVVFLAVGLAHELGVDLATIVADKLAINRSRVWQEPDHLGVVEHVKESPIERPTAPARAGVSGVEGAPSLR